jgi:hypothetical protein
MFGNGKQGGKCTFLFALGFTSLYNTLMRGDLYFCEEWAFTAVISSPGC